MDKKYGAERSAPVILAQSIFNAFPSLEGVRNDSGGKLWPETGSREISAPPAVTILLARGGVIVCGFSRTRRGRGGAV